MSVANRPAKKLLVVICEAALEKAIVDEVRQRGAHGYTVHDVRGAGEHGRREGAWEADRTVEMKVICDADVADAIAQSVLARFGANYGITLFFADVTVIRAEKF